MNRIAIIFCLSVAITNVSMYAMEDMKPFQSADLKNKTKSVCQEASYFLSELHKLKSQTFETVDPKHEDLPETFKKIIDKRSFELQLIKQACNNNTADTQLSRWNEILFASQNTLQITREINGLLSQK